MNSLDLLLPFIQVPGQQAVCLAEGGPGRHHAHNGGAGRRMVPPGEEARVVGLGYFMEGRSRVVGLGKSEEKATWFYTGVIIHHSTILPYIDISWLLMYECAQINL